MIISLLFNVLGGLFTSLYWVKVINVTIYFLQIVFFTYLTDFVNYLNDIGSS